MPGPVTNIRALFEQKVLAGFRHRELERVIRRLFHDPLLYCSQFDIYNAAEFTASERVENHDLVQPVNELWRELPACRLGRGMVHLAYGRLVYSSGHRLTPKRSRFKSHSRLEHGIHFGRSQIPRHENHGARKVHFAVIA